MNPVAIEHATQRLLKAKKGLDQLKEAKNFVEAEIGWSDFLLAASGIYSKLEQGAKGCPKSVPWFGFERHLRKKDPLLRYIHFARNADEHGLKNVTNRSNGNLNIKFNERRPIQVQELDQNTKQPIGPPIDAVLAGPTIKLVRVYNRRAFADPPETHLGEIVPYGGSFPHEVANVALSYLRSMIERATGLPN